MSEQKENALYNIAQRMSDYLRRIAKQTDDDIAFSLSQEWDLKIQEICNDYSKD